MRPGIAGRVIMPLLPLPGTPGIAMAAITTSREAALVILLIIANIGIRHGTGTVWLIGTGTGIISSHRRTIRI